MTTALQLRLRLVVPTHDIDGCSPSFQDADETPRRGRDADETRVKSFQTEGSCRKMGLSGVCGLGSAWVQKCRRSGGGFAPCEKTVTAVNTLKTVGHVSTASP